MLFRFLSAANRLLLVTSRFCNHTRQGVIMADRVRLKRLHGNEEGGSHGPKDVREAQSSREFMERVSVRDRYSRKTA